MRFHQQFLSYMQLDKPSSKVPQIQLYDQPMHTKEGNITKLSLG